MSFLRENGKSAKTDDDSLKFILIDRNQRKSTNSSAFKDLEPDLEKQKLRKRMFWSRNANNTLDTTKPLMSTFPTSNSIITSNALNTLSRPFSKLKHKPHLFGVKLEKLTAQTGQLPAPLLVSCCFSMFFRFNSFDIFNRIYWKK